MKAEAGLFDFLGCDQVGISPACCEPGGAASQFVQCAC